MFFNIGFASFLLYNKENVQNCTVMVKNKEKYINLNYNNIKRRIDIAALTHSGALPISPRTTPVARRDSNPHLRILNSASSKYC
jgi:hypothetical protein